MLKTSPTWMDWRNTGNISTCSSRVDAQTGEGADVEFAPDPDVLIKSIARKKILDRDGNVLKDETLSGKRHTQRQKKILIKSNSRVKNTETRLLDINEDDAKSHISHGWSLGRGSYNVNTNRTGSSFDYETLRNRKLSSTLSLLFGKIAEERMGDKIEGADKWDIEKIMFRRISKKIITDCKYAREKKHLVLMLDSSPSCRSMAKTYSAIATESANFDDVEIYDAPNGYAHSIYDPRTKEFRKLEREELNCTYYWNGFENRTIIYFGDNDATRIIDKAYKHNEIHWFYQYSYGCASMSDKILHTDSLRENWSGKLHVHLCNDIEQLMRSVRDMR